MDLRPLGTGTRLLLGHPMHTLGLALMMVLLSLLVPVLQIWGPVPDEPVATVLVLFAAMLPVDLYFLPRYLLRLDAETLNPPANPRASWKATFEHRWLKAIVAKAVLYLVVGSGMTCMLVPGLVLFAFLGWMPLRVLLRGDGMGGATRFSMQLTVRFWPRMVLPILVILGLYVGAIYALPLADKFFFTDPSTPWIQLTHPLAWGIGFFEGLLNLWVSAAFLALYHRLEALHAEAPVDASDTSA